MELIRKIRSRFLVDENYIWVTEDEMLGWNRQLNGYEFEQTPGYSKGQESLACCSPQGCKESGTTQQLNNICNIDGVSCQQRKIVSNTNIYIYSISMLHLLCILCAYICMYILCVYLNLEEQNIKSEPSKLDQSYHFLSIFSNSITDVCFSHSLFSLSIDR